MALSKSGIDYLTHVLNVAVGCNEGCGYCWARRLAKRIGKNIGCELCVRFVPHVHSDRLEDITPRQKPHRIGVGFMCDLFGLGNHVRGRFESSDKWDGLYLLTLLAQVMAFCSQHRFLIPTRHPENIPTDIEWPSNVAFLITCTNQEEADERLPVALECIRGGPVIAKPHDWP